ncbi:putative L,D-transpeptidase YciB precursor [Clostridium homopropionicum DSM 5847]|uniref:Putative L,D-transpeptidase YciB n=1 Tax=Clostridium homopropionicum DSM 5847 TaxID=1121318 RepID=A0A0L6Z7Z9_9CLOT|nr:L,D-transpeptidase [Clostridium homopropionicum]KOA19090.1 putative L,D-transpeptidase YciB precursor [Clostridium homopropionicum DSM 5847]SFG83383.1 Lipoprotein-anchoring transpeptidase ErfK/SrfK [Clostridium homopropionicum]
MEKKYYKFLPITLLLGIVISLIFGQDFAYAITYPKIQSIVQEYETIYEGEEQALDIVTAYEGKVQYRVWMHSKGENAWTEVTKGYTEVIEGNRVYSITTPKLLEGEYEVSVWVKRAGAVPKDSRGFDSYAATTIKCGKLNVEHNKPKLNTFKSKYSLGETLEIKRESTEENLFKLTVYDILKNKEVVSFNDYKESISWKPKEEGVYLLKLTIKSREEVKPSNNEDETKNENDGNENTEQKQEVEYKEVETKINKLIIVGNPYKEKLPTVPKAPKVTSIVVGNAREVEKIYIKAEPKKNSKNLGYIYGSLNAVKILKKVGDFYYIEATNYETLKLVEGYVYTWQVKTVKPKEGRSILVDLSEQKIYIFKGETLEKTFKCSTGQDWSPTPKGTYLIGDRGERFYTGYKNSIVCYNWVRINNDFLFHSVLHDRNGNLIKLEADKLGQKASHGCIRLAVNDIKWIYNNIPKGTLVVIQD